MPELTEEQIEFLNIVVYNNKKWTLNSEGKVDVDCSVYMNDVEGIKRTEIPVKFGVVNGYFYCNHNNLTTLKNLPDCLVGGYHTINCKNNNLSNYFKNIKEEDFPQWKWLYWFDVLQEYPFLINIGKKYLSINDLKYILNKYPQTKLYYRD